VRRRLLTPRGIDRPRAMRATASPFFIAAPDLKESIKSRRWRHGAQAFACVKFQGNRRLA
jgi:hypothetical protein